MATGITRLHCCLVILLLLSACAGTVRRSGRAQSTATIVAQVPTSAAGPTAAATPSPTRTPAPTPDPDVRQFAVTGHTIRGAFRRFWEGQGGLAAFGLPLTEALPIDGVTVQYFERARFETRDGLTVALGRLGAEARMDQGTRIA